MTTRYERAAAHDKRIARGDDYAGDAWRDPTTGALIWVVVGHDANAPTAQFAINTRGETADQGLIRSLRDLAHELEMLGKRWQSERCYQAAKRLEQLTRHEWRNGDEWGPPDHAEAP